MIVSVSWNLAAYKLLGGIRAEHPDAVRLAEVERRSGSRLPGAVREWFAVGGDEQLARIVHNRITKISDLAESRVSRFLDSGYLLLETDSQHCCQWVTSVHAVEDDPPVYLIDPDDYACGTRTRYADQFSSYTFTCAWDALLWHDDVVTDFDHPLPATALDRLRAQFSELPTTFGWAMNQGCDAVYRFEGAARVGLAISGDTALWSAISAPSPGVRESVARIVGASM
jgi:hypothetical protein